MTKLQHPAIEGLAIGLDRGHPVTKNVRKPRQSRKKGRITKKTRIVREVVREVLRFFSILGILFLFTLQCIFMFPRFNSRPSNTFRKGSLFLYFGVILLCR